MTDQYGKTHIADLLDAALTRAAAGEPLDACLADTGAHREEIAALLRLGTTLRAERDQVLPAHLATWIPVGGGQFARAAQRELTRQPRFGGWRRSGIIRLILAGALAGSLGFTVDTVSASSLPGEALYSWKRAREELALSLAATPGARQQLHVEFANRRITEVEMLVNEGVAEDSQLIAGAIENLTSHVQNVADEQTTDPAVSVLIDRTRRTLDTVADTEQTPGPASDAQLQLEAIADKKPTATPVASRTVTPAAPIDSPDVTVQPEASVVPVPPTPPATRRPARATATATSTPGMLSVATETPALPTATSGTGERVEPTPTSTPTDEPTETVTVRATSVPTRAPAATATRTSVVVPTAPRIGATEAPTAPPPPTAPPAVRPPRATATPRANVTPRATATPRATITPRATATAEPTATNTSVPSATSSPEPTATNTSVPSATSTPEPAATATAATTTATPATTAVTIVVVNDAPTPTPTSTTGG